jgi:glycosyltransferase involved in cell wall biosynthesis
MVFNHESYIREAIEGILKQKTTFLIEVVVGDDFSTDNSLEIIREYKNTTHIHFKILERKIGDDYWQNRQKIGRLYNFCNIIENCSGKYIALLDGDDFWTDPYKLQKQVDFLEANPEYVGCFHKIKALLGDSLVEDKGIEQRFEKVGDKNKITRLDLLEQGNFIHTCSFIFRNESIILSNEMRMSPVGDIMLFLELTKIGFLKRIDEYMAVYRRGTGIYSSLSIVEMCKKKLQYHMCILSSLTDEVERIHFLKISLDLIQVYEKMMILERKSVFRKKIDLIKILIFKFSRKIYRK